MRSREYVLRELDDWYANRFRDNYTDEVAIDISNRILKSVKVRGDSSLALKLIKSRALEEFSREKQIETAQKYFSQSYATIEGMINGLSIEGHNFLDDMSKERKEEYVTPILEQYRKMQEFVESVRKIPDQNIERKVTRSDIDNLFLDTFDDHNGFSEFIQAYMGAMPYFFDFMVARGKMSRREFDHIVTLLDITKQEMPYLNEIVFGDLKRG